MIISIHNKVYKEQKRADNYFFTRFESTVALLRWVFAQNKWAIRMVVVVCRHRHTFVFVVILFTFMQQFRQAASAAEIDAELIEQSTVKELMLLCH